ncbi:MAG: hypothetical protein HZB55_12850 [Deltaproteobacteria bacterium]|nr:hypothetical protein [Deltaproteobacteria bacterium]
MLAKVTDNGVTIPKDLLSGAETVDIRQEGNVVVIVPVSLTDPLLDLGKAPVTCGAPDASERHDEYV